MQMIKSNSLFMHYIYIYVYMDNGQGKVKNSVKHQKSVFRFHDLENKHYLSQNAKR